MSRRSTHCDALWTICVGGVVDATRKVTKSETRSGTTRATLHVLCACVAATKLQLDSDRTFRPLRRGARQSAVHPNVDEIILRLGTFAKRETEGTMALSVLWVEDSLVFYTQMVAILSRFAAFDFVHTPSNEAALRAIESRTFDRLIIDVCLAGYGDESGLEFLEHTRARGISTPAIVFSGELTLELQERARALGAIDLVKKGAEHDPKALVRIIERADRPSLARAIPADAHERLAAEIWDLPQTPTVTLEALEQRILRRARDTEPSHSAAARRVGMLRQSYVAKLKKVT